MAVKRTHVDCEPKIPGTQAIHRAASLLKQVACANSEGVKLQALCEQLGLEMSTAHRILRSLVAEGLVSKEETSGRYRLGPVTYELGLAATPHLDIRALCAPSMRRLAANSGDTVFLLVRSDLDAVCADRAEGAFPIKVLTLDVGMRRPLGVSAGAVALLMALPGHQSQAILQANSTRFAQFDVALDTAVRSLEDANRQGFAMNDQLTVRGQRGVAVPCKGRDGRPVASLSIAAICSRMTRTRIPELISLLNVEAASIEQRLATHTF